MFFSTSSGFDDDEDTFSINTFSHNTPHIEPITNISLVPPVTPGKTRTSESPISISTCSNPSVESTKSDSISSAQSNTINSAQIRD